MKMSDLSKLRPRKLGMMTGMKVTFVTMIKTWAFNLSGGRVGLRSTVNYPVVKETPVARARGVIALDQDNCTVCMLCARPMPRLVHLHRRSQGRETAVEARWPSSGESDS